MFKNKDVLIGPNLFNEIQPLFQIIRIAGLCPVDFIKKGSLITLKLSLKLCSISCGAVITLALLAIWGIFNDASEEPKNSIRMKTPTLRYISICDISVVIISCSLGVCLTPFKLKDLWIVLNRLNQIDAITPLTETDIKEKRKWSYYCLWSTIITISFLIIFDISARSIFVADHNGFIDILKNYSAYYTLYYVVIIQEFYYFHLVHLIKRRITSINSILLPQNGAHSFKELILTNSWFSVLGPDFLSHKHKATPEKPLTLNRILTLMRLHEFICEAIHGVNKLCGYTVLLIMISCLMHLVVTPYFLFIEIRKSGPPVRIILQLLWTLAHIVRLLFVVEPCEACISENETTANLTFKILSCAELSEDIRKELSTFAVQLTYRRMKFTALGLMTIRRAILTSVSSSITTYLVILFQFARDS